MLKTALVTGASSGIGEAIARKLASENINVVLLARRKERLNQIMTSINEAKLGEALAVEADVADLNAFESAVRIAEDHFGEIDILVNNAGVMISNAVTSFNVADWDRMIDVNIKGVLYGLNLTLPQMLERNKGHIINISSVAGHEVTKVNSVYSATKFAAKTISYGLEKELAQSKVRVTNISPGLVDTDLLKGYELKRKPLSTEDIANAVIYAIGQPNYVNVNEITIRPK